MNFEPDTHNETGSIFRPSLLTVLRGRLALQPVQTADMLGISYDELFVWEESTQRFSPDNWAAICRIIVPEDGIKAMSLEQILDLNRHEDFGTKRGRI